LCVCLFCFRLRVWSLQAGVHGNEWKELVLEATTEALKLPSSSSMALLFQALLQFTTKMAARSVLLLLYLIDPSSYSSSSIAAPKHQWLVDGSLHRPSS